MEKNPNFDLQCDFFSARRLEDVVVLRFKKNLLLHATDFSFRDKVLGYFDLVSGNDSIKVVVIISSSEKRGSEEYFDFFHQALKQKWNRFPVHRMHNVFAQVIMKILSLNQIVIHANRGRVISLFLNVSLACDHRLVSSCTVYQNPYLKHGLVPIGGGAFFLSKMLGSSKAYEILLSKNDITAQEAMRLGIVDKVVSPDKLEESALEVARRFAQKPARSLAGVKRLVNYSTKDIKDYMELEYQEFTRMVEEKHYRC